VTCFCCEIGAAKTQCQLAVDAVRPGSVGQYVPKCDERGNYQPMQVHGSTGYRWCVDTLGREIPGSRRGPSEKAPVCGTTDGKSRVETSTFAPLLKVSNVEISLVRTIFEGESPV